MWEAGGEKEEHKQTLKNVDYRSKNPEKPSCGKHPSHNLLALVELVRVETRLGELQFEREDVNPGKEGDEPEAAHPEHWDDVEDLGDHVITGSLDE